MQKAEDFLILIILDGWGLREETEANAVYLAPTPHIDEYYKKYPWTRLTTSGEDVGLPPRQMGNSEVGHLNLGAGRIVYQEIMRISKAIEKGNFFKNQVLLSAVKHAKQNNSSLHLMGLLSDGGVHSHNTHLYALLELAKKEGLTDVYIHPILDGRDTPPSSAAYYLEELEKEISKIGIGTVASIAGRYYSMDRDKRWERTEKAYRCYVYGEGRKFYSSLQAVNWAYENGETDEFVSPALITDDSGLPRSLIKDNDAVIFFNFRADRARQITRAFTDKDFSGFDRGSSPSFPYFVCFTEYDMDLNAPVAFLTENLTETIGEVLSTEGLQQLRIAETEKYAHVTYFFSGGREKSFDGEDRILISSPQEVATYDMKPEMSAEEVTREVLKQLDEKKYSLIVLNYANPDMVGHTGDLEAAVKAVATVDEQVGAVVDRTLSLGGAVIITSDHGNAEIMTEEDGTPHTAHTDNETPFILLTQDNNYQIQERGKLADIAPTILSLLSLPVPVKMEGKVLAQKTVKSR